MESNSNRLEQVENRISGLRDKIDMPRSGGEGREVAQVYTCK
jgi:hypothetical protein